ELDGVERGIRFLQSGDREKLISYAGLLCRAKGLLGRLQQQGLQAGDPVILFVRHNQAFVDAFWACQLGGMVPVPLSAGVHSEYLHKLTRVAEKFAKPFLFTERDLFLRLTKWLDGKAPFAQRVCVLEEIDQLEQEGVLHSAAPEDTALIQFSSGSTSEPKGVVLSHTNLLVNIKAISRAAAISCHDSTLSWMPLSHDMGLIGFHLVPLFNGLDQVLMDTDLFVRRPARWLETAHRYRTSLLCSPNFGYQHYLRSVSAPADSLDLSNVRLIFNGAEPVSASVCREFAQRLGAAGLDASAFYPVYGLAEASLAVTFPDPGSGVQSLCVPVDTLSMGHVVTQATRSDRCLELVCLGHPLENCELRICDQNGWTLPDYSPGHVQIRGDNVTSGYYQCPHCDESAFVDGWLDTGDLGFMSGRGLFITGRCKELVFVSGQNWYPQDIEQLLQQMPGIEAGKVAVGALRSESNAEDLLLVFIRFRRELDSFVELVRRVRSALTEHAGLHAHAVIPVHNLPRTSSGKLQRYRLVQAFEKGEYAELLASLQAFLQSSDSPSPESGVVRQLLDVCRELFPDRTIRSDQNLFELGADSLMLVKIHEEIEARFPGKVEVTDLFEYPTISSLAEYLQG
ncbi:MAG: non-ribosomal peptide synthetase, partial [Pseudomonadota bacterium]|nr:non-ribosomal peptide synthetase [Pseudomonadota bacterium]